MRISTFIFIVFLSFQSYSQLEKGNMYLSGTLGLSVSNNQFESFGIRPSFGYLLSDKWAIGGQGLFSFNSFNPNYHNFASGVGFFGRRYIAIADRFYFSVIGSLMYLHSESKLNPNYHSSSNGAALTFQPNFTFFPSPHWALEANIGAIGYSFLRSNTAVNSHNFDLQYGSISLGVSYYFGKGFKGKE